MDDTAEIRDAATRFLQAFDELDWERFRAFLAREPSVFFPFDDTPGKVSGREAVEARFRRFFDDVRARTQGPPYLHLAPRDLTVERHGSAGLVTFTLAQPPALGGPPGRVARRTLLFIREDNAWRLAHLHASAA